MPTLLLRYKKKNKHVIYQGYPWLIPPPPPAAPQEMCIWAPSFPLDPKFHF